MSKVPDPKFVCSEVCWTPVRCSHGYWLPPAGRSAPDGYHWCEEGYPSTNPRHLWDEHDSTRWYHDKEGWADHEANCPQCNPSLEDEDES